MTQQPNRDAIATYVMAKPDSTLVAQITTALQKRGRTKSVLLLPGDLFVTGLVKELLLAADLEIVGKAEHDASGKASSPLLTISVPLYMRQVGPGSVVFNDCWDRPMIIAQSVGEALQTWPDNKKLRIGSSWLWWAMSYRMWSDIENVRDFVFHSLNLTEALGGDMLTLDKVLGEFEKNGQLEKLFKVCANTKMQYFPPFKGREPIPMPEYTDFQTSMGFQPHYTLKERVEENWSFYAPSGLLEIACLTRSTELLRSDDYFDFPIRPEDSLPFLKEINWWEKKMGDRQEDDLSGVFEDGWAYVQMYCRGRWSVSEAKLAKKMGLTPAKLRNRVSELHLRTEFGGEQDGYQQWLQAREELQLTNLTGSQEHAQKSFSELEFCYVDPGSFESSSNGKQRRRHSAADMGMVNVRSRTPSESWYLFVGCLDTNRPKSEPGLVPAKVRKQYVSKIRKCLCNRFRLDDDPFHKFEPGKGWKLRSKVLKPSDLARVDTSAPAENTRETRAKEWLDSDLETAEHMAKRKVTKEFSDSDKDDHSG